MATTGKWDGARLERFQEALLEAFPHRVELERLILFGLDGSLDAITSETNLQAAVFAVLKWAKAQGKLELLLERARRINLDNPVLRALAEERAPFLVPFAMDSEFVGRSADLERLHGLLKKGTAGVQRAALVGMGGVGKTQLAVEYAHLRRSDYPGGVYWVNAAAPLVAELATLAERLGLREDTASEAERPGQRSRAFERHLHENPGALVIFDNVADPLALREVTAGIVPWELPCHLLFTTRRRDLDARFETLSVGVLSENAALHLLLSSKARRALLEGGRADELQAARAICGALGYLPLAIVLAAAYLGKSLGLALSDYLLRLRREGALTTADAAKVDPLRLATQHTAVVEATLRTQWDALVTPEARHALTAATLLRNAAHVSRATLAQLTGLSDEAKGGYPAPLEQALNELSEWSLVEELTQKAIRLHPLVREFAAARIEKREAFAAACARRLGEALGEMGRLEDEVRARGLDAVLADLRLGEELAGAEGRETFRRLLRPLDREAHCLRRWDPAREPGFFLQQVRNVSFELGMAEVQEQAEAALHARGRTWLGERLRTSRESEALVRTLAGHTSSVWGVAMMPDGRSVLSASHDGTLKVWEISSGCELRTLAGHSSQVNGVAVTPDGLLAVSASDDGTLKVWDLASGREIHTLAGHTDLVNGVAVTPDGRCAISASADTTLKIWDLASGREVRTLQGHALAVNGVVVTPGGRLVVSASEDGTLKVWELSSGREVRTLEGHDDSVMEVAVTPDGRFAISASSDNTLKVWELSSGYAIHTLAGHTEPVKEVAVTPDGRLAISASHDNTLKIWELSSGREVCAYEGHTHAVPGVAVAPDGRFAVSASWDKTLKVWELSTHDQVRTLEGHTALVTRVAVTADGCFAISASSDKTLKVWELSSGRELRTLAGHTWEVTGVAVTPHGRWVVSASGDKTLKVWELSSGREHLTLHGHTGGVTGVAVTPDGRLAISASDDTTLKIWDLATGREKQTLTGHTNTVTGVAVTPDGRLAISASEDTTLRVWDLAEGRSIATLEAHAPLLSCAVAPDGCTFLVGDGAGSLHVLEWILPQAEARGPLAARFAATRVANEGRLKIRAVAPGLTTRHSPETTRIRSAPISAAFFSAAASTTGASAAPTATVAEPPALTRHRVRTLLYEILCSDSDLDAFCLDFFDEVHARFSNGMDRVDKVNRLLERVPLDLIVDALRTSHPSKLT